MDSQLLDPRIKLPLFVIHYYDYHAQLLLLLLELSVKQVSSQKLGVFVLNLVPRCWQLTSPRRNPVASLNSRDEFASVDMKYQSMWYSSN